MEVNLKLEGDRKSRVLRTLKQSLKGLLLSTAVLAITTLTGVLTVEFQANSTVWPMLTVLITVLAAVKQNLKDQHREHLGGDQNTN